MGGDEGAHHPHGPSGRRTASDFVRDFLGNWSAYDGSFGKKVRLTLANRAKAYSPPFEGCCHHPGEPGC